MPDSSHLFQLRSSGYAEITEQLKKMVFFNSRDGERPPIPPLSSAKVLNGGC